MDFKNCAKSIIDKLGGTSNIEMVDHCATRLRFKLQDASKVDEEGLKGIEGVIAVENKDTYQVAIGKEVKDVYLHLVEDFKIKGKKDVKAEIYNRAKQWEIGFFALNNTATNCYMFLMNFLSYYAVGIAGLLTAVVGTILTAMRIFDGITDPIIGFIIDKTDGKLGKFRPFMILGQAILLISTILMYKTVHLVPESFRIIYFILIYVVYIIGYTFQTACTKAGQACLTNDPKQRPVFSMFDGVYNTVLFTGGQILVSSVFIAKTGGFNAQFFDYMLLTWCSLSLLFTVLAVIGIWSHDRTEFFGLGQGGKKLKVRDYVEVIKHNKAIQMLVISGSTDKLASCIMSNSILTTILYGILIGNYAMSGTVSLIILVPTLLFGLYGMNLSRKTGMKKALVVSSWLNIIVCVIFGAFMLMSDMSQINMANGITVFTVIFIILLIVRGAVGNVSGNIVIPMIADCADYETYRSGRYVPGMMGTLFSFIDKLISSLATTIVSVGLAMIGFASTLPQIGDPVTTILKVFFVAMYIGAPLIGLIANVISMKFYPLTKEKMEEVQLKIAEIKAGEGE